MHLGANLTVKTRLCQKKNIVKPKYCYDNENTTLCTHSSLLWPHSVHHACMFDQHHPCNLHSSDVTSSTWLQKQWFRSSLLQRMQHSSAERAITKHLAAIQNKCPISIDFLWACLRPISPSVYQPAFVASVTCSLGACSAQSAQSDPEHHARTIFPSVSETPIARTPDRNQSSARVDHPPISI